MCVCVNKVKTCLIFQGVKNILHWAPVQVKSGWMTIDLKKS